MRDRSSRRELWTRDPRDDGARHLAGATVTRPRRVDPADSSVNCRSAWAGRQSVQRDGRNGSRELLALRGRFPMLTRGAVDTVADRQQARSARYRLQIVPEGHPVPLIDRCNEAADHEDCEEAWTESKGQPF